MGNPSRRYETSAAIAYGMRSPATRHRWTRPAINTSQTGRRSIYRPRRDEGLSWRWCQPAWDGLLM